jgi:hypothetical protein
MSEFPGKGDEKPPARAFGLLVATALLGTAIYREASSGNAWGYSGSLWLGAAAAAMLLLALLAPSAFAVPAFLWMRLGRALSRVSNPVILAILFFAIVWPMGVLMRWLGKSSVTRGPDATMTTYWIERSPQGPESASMIDQF